MIIDEEVEEVQETVTEETWKCRDQSADRDEVAKKVKREQPILPLPLSTNSVSSLK